MGHVCGVLLAAGSGRRLGLPKALLVSHGESLLGRTVTRLLQGGCDDVVVVLGDRAEEAQDMLGDRAAHRGGEGDRVQVVVAEDWQSGQSASLQAGLAAVGRRRTRTDAALVHLTDLPDVSAGVVHRVLGSWEEGGSSPEALLRATYAGTPGHPVLLGRSHWGPVAADVSGDMGARDYLAAREVTAVECGDLATGVDVDRPEDLP